MSLKLKLLPIAELENCYQFFKKMGDNPYVIKMLQVLESFSCSYTIQN